MVKGLAAIAAPLQFPAGIESQGHKGVAVAGWQGRAPHHQILAQGGGAGQQAQVLAALLQAQPQGAGAKAAALPVAQSQRIAVAVEVAPADAGEVEAVQAGVHQAVGALLPAQGRWLDLLQHQQGPLPVAEGATQHRIAAWIHRPGFEELSGLPLGRQSEAGHGPGCGRGHQGTSGQGQVSSLHGRVSGAPGASGSAAGKGPQFKRT